MITFTYLEWVILSGFCTTYIFIFGILLGLAIEKFKVELLSMQPWERLVWVIPIVFWPVSILLGFYLSKREKLV